MIRETINVLRIEHLVIYGGSDYTKYISGHLPKTKKTKFHMVDGYVARRRKK